MAGSEIEKASVRRGRAARYGGGTCRARSRRAAVIRPFAVGGQIIPVFFDLIVFAISNDCECLPIYPYTLFH
jgi:hypothetical protein